MSSKPGTADIDDDYESGKRNTELRRNGCMLKTPMDCVEQDAKETPSECHNPSKTNSFLTDIKHLKVEVILFLYMFSYTMRVVTSTTMIMDKVCLVHLNYSSEICAKLKDNPVAKIQVGKLANNYNLGYTLIHFVPSSILGLFIGAWSDKYGRKLPLIVALLGIIIDGCGSTFCAAYLHTRVEFYYLAAMFTGMSGGFIVAQTVLFCYASDITTFAKRTMKYAFMEMTIGLSLPLGQLAGGWIFKWSGYETVFMVSTAGHVIGLVWVMSVFQETTGLDNKDSWKIKFKSLWAVKPVIDGMKATFMARPNKGREQLLLLILSMSLSAVSFSSTAGINFLYVNQVYDWDNTTFSTIIAIFSVTGTFTMLISVAICKRMGLGDPTLGIVGTMSLMIKLIGIGAATKEEIFYVANAVGLLSGLTSLAGRSRISKVVAKNDIGKIFAFLTTAQSLIPLIAAIIVSQIFSATLDIYAGLIYIILGGLLIVPLFVYIWLSRLPVVDYENAHDNTVAETKEECADNVNGSINCTEMNNDDCRTKL